MCPISILLFCFINSNKHSVCQPFLSTFKNSFPKISVCRFYANKMLLRNFICVLVIYRLHPGWFKLGTLADKCAIYVMDGFICHYSWKLAPCACSSAVLSLVTALRHVAQTSRADGVRTMHEENMPTLLHASTRFQSNVCY